MTLYNCDDSYLLVPCWGRGCTGGCPCGRGAATRGAPSTGTETAATRPGSAGRTVSNTKWIKRTRHIAQWHNHMYIILITPESPVPRSRSPDTVMSRHERRGSSDFYTSLCRPFLNTFGHFILPILTKVCYLLYCHKSPLRPMISRITALLLSVCGTERQLLCCSSLRCGCRSRERRDVIASAGPRPALISQELNLNLKWMLEIVQRAASRRVMVTAGNEPSRSLKS